jgi:CheY-like chemotaxis protein
MLSHHAISPYPPFINNIYLFGNDAELNQPEASASDTPTRQKQKRRALVVDDAPDITEMLAMMLRHVGYDVVAVFSATEALKAARVEQFDIIISDIGMPEMNGYELAGKLRALPNYQSVPLIAVTGFAMHDDRNQALSAGFNHFLAKPINPLTLIELVESL